MRFGFAAVVNAGDAAYIFALKDKDGQSAVFERITIRTGLRENGHVQVQLPASLPKPDAIVTKGAYDLQAKMTNSEEE